MQLKPAVETALNNQITHEFFAERVYLAMAAWFDEQDLPGFAHWYRVQAEEEHAHAMRIYDFVLRRRGRVELQALDAPPHEWPSPLDAVTAALEHERSVTELIHELHALAAESADRATQVEMDWFVTEQVEEEDAADNLVSRVRMAADSAPAMLLLDTQLAGRGAGADADQLN